MTGFRFPCLGQLVDQCRCTEELYWDPVLTCLHADADGQHGLPCPGSAIHHKVIAGSVEFQCFQGIHGNTGRELYFIRAEGRKIMLYGKSCRIYQLCHPCCFTVPDLFTQEIVDYSGDLWFFRNYP